jgi:hypothetical protein
MSAAERVEVADVFRQYGAAYREEHRLPLAHLKAMRAIERCRTANLGGHVQQCNACGHQKIAYNSCRNRHCPKCQTGKREKWLFDRKQELLPIRYYHVVFTVPEDINPLALSNQRVVYNIFFRAASETLLELGRDPKHLGGEIGIMAVLHTWGQNLMDHPHVHCIVTGGGLSPEGRQWLRAKKSGEKKIFFIHVNILSALFKRKFMAYLCEAYERGSLKLVGRMSHLKDQDQFRSFKQKLYSQKWVSYCKGTIRKAEQVVDYLGRYTHRVAISNSRLLKMENGQVTFKWRDYRDHNRQKQMTLDAYEFIRRFLLHILPRGYYKIRYYGMLSNRYRKAKLQLCRRLLKVKDKVEEATFNLLDALFYLTGLDLSCCPACHQGRMVIVKYLMPSYKAPP